MSEETKASTDRMRWLSRALVMIKTLCTAPLTLALPSCLLISLTLVAVSANCRVKLSGSSPSPSVDPSSPLSESDATALAIS